MFRNGNQIKTYRIALGRSPLGAKQEEGDMKTPEGIYKIDGRNPQSSFHLALHISYPSDEDDKRAAAHGVSAGFDIMIHGIQNGRGWIGAFHRWNDWTAGCIAVTDEEIEELWRVTPDGTTIEIRHERPDWPNDFLKLSSSVALFRHRCRRMIRPFPLRDRRRDRCIQCSLRLGEAFCDLTQNTGLASSLDTEHVGLKRGLRLRLRA